MRTTKLIFACAAWFLGRLVSVVRILSGLVVLHRPKAFARAKVGVPPESPKARNLDAWEKQASLAEREITKILPGWSIAIHILPCQSLSYEFVLRAKTPPSWLRPGREWCARLLISPREMFNMRRDRTMQQNISKKLCEFARDIRRKALVYSGSSVVITGTTLLAARW